MRISNLLALMFLSVPLGFGQVVHVTHGQEPTLPKPFTGPVVANPPQGSPSTGFMPTALPGFKVSMFAKGFKEPRYLAVAPNGDVSWPTPGATRFTSCTIPAMARHLKPARSLPTILTSRSESPSTTTMSISRTPMR